MGNTRTESRKRRGKYNLVMACHSCNNARGIMDVEQFIELIVTDSTYRQYQRDAEYRNEKRAMRRAERQEKFSFWLALYLFTLPSDYLAMVNKWINGFKEADEVIKYKERVANTRRLTSIRRRAKNNRMVA